MILVEMLKRILFPTWGIQKIIPIKQSREERNPWPTKAVRDQPLGPVPLLGSGSTCHWPTKSEQLKLAQDKKSKNTLETPAPATIGMTGVQARWSLGPVQIPLTHTL